MPKWRDVGRGRARVLACPVQPTWSQENQFTEWRLRWCNGIFLKPKSIEIRSDLDEIWLLVKICTAPISEIQQNSVDDVDVFQCKFQISQKVGVFINFVAFEHILMKFPRRFKNF